jgi:hypothetical protein
MVLGLSACSWQRVPDAPQYGERQPLPATIGIVPAENPGAQQLATALASEWKKMGLFKAIDFPYRPGDQVDGVLKLDATGKATGSGAAAGVVTGLTFGLAGTVVGPSVTTTHDVSVSLYKGDDLVSTYNVHVQTSVEWGMFANVDEVARKASELQLRTIAVEIAKKLDSDREKIRTALASRN